MKPHQPKMDQFQMAMHLHFVLNQSITQWGIESQKTYGVLPGEALVWVVTAAMSLELLVAAHSSNQPITHLMNIVRAVVTSPQAVTYAQDMVRQYGPKPTKGIVAP